jgi:hypothetical protein
MAVEIEARPYGPNDFTPEVVDAIKARVFIRPDGIVVWRDMPQATIHSTNLLIEQFLGLTKDLPSYLLLVDITGTAIPPAELRERYKQFFRGEYDKGRFKALAYVTGGNFLINAAARFVAAAIGVKPFSVHKLETDAIAALHAVRGA